MGELIDDWPYPLGTPPDGWHEAGETERVQIVLVYHRALLEIWRKHRDDQDPSNVDDRAQAAEIIAALMVQIDAIESVAWTRPEPTMREVLAVLAERERRTNDGHG